MDKKPIPSAPTPKSPKTDRLAAALKANLMRRKAASAPKKGDA